MSSTEKNNILNNNQVEILGVRIHDIDKNKVTEILQEYLASKKQHCIVTPGPEFLVRAHKDEKFKKILNDADLAIPDGFGLRLVAPHTIHHTVTGVDVTEYLMERIHHERGEILIVLPKVSLTSKEKIEKVLKEKFPGLRVRIMQAGAEVFKDMKPVAVFAALGSPEQEYWMEKNKTSLPSVKIFMGVGGSFDLITNTLKRAPKIFRLLGLEWLWRLILEPKRIKRILTATVYFPYLVIKSKWSKK